MHCIYCGQDSADASMKSIDGSINYFHRNCVGTRENSTDILQDFAVDVVAQLLEFAAIHPRAFRNFFCGAIVANVVGNMPDEHWAKFSKMEPCGQPGCDCHLANIGFMTALKELREDHQRHCPKTIVE
jgi:hypothetical protein